MRSHGKTGGRRKLSQELTPTQFNKVFPGTPKRSISSMFARSPAGTSAASLIETIGSRCSGFS